MKKIEIIDEKTIKVDGDIFRRDDVSTFFDTPENTKLEFKVGDWIIGVYSYTPDIPARILNINGNFADVDIPNGDNYHWKNDHSVFWRLATKEEIESHLKKVAKEKGFVEGAVYHSINSEGGFYSNTDVVPRYAFWRYGEEGDTFDCGDGLGWIYKNGQWATIIPQKKSLPKTKKELQELLKDIQDDAELPFPIIDINELLTHYED